MTDGVEVPEVHLAPREIEALQWRAYDCKGVVIAKKMLVSTGHVANLLNSARRKLSVSSTDAAIAQAFRLGLLK